MGIQPPLHLKSVPLNSAHRTAEADHPSGIPTCALEFWNGKDIIL